ncbi:unnamed protein product [Microthlaspi erraticum]|uniref:Uncharacterized protein n=1 Tax=Microthlaspi erraticum TaxID=1685480 RepID=A0A6D2IF62_9BRAS|nr:unnamed protein product [Microthlaspi erraticum]
MHRPLDRGGAHGPREGVGDSPGGAAGALHKECNAPRLVSSIVRDCSVLMNYEFNHLGRIWVVWKQNTHITPSFKSGQLITCSVKLEDQEDGFFCPFVYASNSMEERK